MKLKNEGTLNCPFSLPKLVSTDTKHNLDKGFLLEVVTPERKFRIKVKRRHGLHIYADCEVSQVNAYGYWYQQDKKPFNALSGWYPADRVK